MRKASTNWLGKSIMAAVMFLLIASFAIWGIGDIFRGFGMSTVAKIGRTEITTEQFRQIYNDRLQQLGRQIGRPITTDQARALGLDRQVLGQVLAETALDEQARDLHLGLSDADVVQRITKDPSFRGLSGQFDANRFQQIIRQAGYSEARYVAEQRQAAMRRQLVDSLVAGLEPPETAVNALNQFQNEQRAIEYVVLGPAQAGDIAPPTPDVLMTYFNAHKLLFRAPEYRKITTLQLSPADVAKGIEVSDDDVKSTYEQRKARYVTPERRQVEQIVFPNMEEAKAASDRLKQGLTFEQLATERGLKEKDTDLGTVSKDGMIDRAAADAAFVLKDGETTEPVKGGFGIALLHVSKIEPGSVRPYAEAADEIRKELALARAKSQLLDIHDKVEDERAGGAGLPEIAQKMKLSAVTIEAVDRSGRGPDDQPVAGLPKDTDVLPAAFASDVGVDTDALQTPDGGFIWFEVAGITPSRDRGFDEVKSKVEQAWRKDEIASKLKVKAQDTVDKLKGGTSLADIAAADQTKVDSATGLKRSEADGLPPGVLTQVFKMAKDIPTSEQGLQPTEWYVFKVTEITQPNLISTSPAAKRLQDVWRKSLSENVLAEYVGHLENELGTNINQSALTQILGNGS